MPTVALRGIEVHYERSGHGPRLLFVNGSGASLRTSALLLAPFAERFDLVAHDQRGLGETTVPDDQPTMADYTADALALPTTSAGTRSALSASASAAWSPRSWP